MVAAEDDVGSAFGVPGEAEDFVWLNNAEDDGGVCGHEDLSAVNGGEGLVHGFDSAGVNAVLGFLDEVDAGEVREISGEGEGEEAEGSVGGHPRGDGEAALVGEGEVAMAIVRTFHRVHVNEIREGGLEMRDPVSETWGGAFAEALDNPGEI
jgi:hypothetical protein